MYKQFFRNSIVIDLVFVFVIILTGSCEHDLTLDIKTNDKRLIVVGEFTTDSIVHDLRLSCSGSLITGQKQTGVSGAVIYLTDKEDTFYYYEDKDTAGLYKTMGKCKGKGGHAYFLSISGIDIDKDGLADSYQANTTMPLPIVFDSLVSKFGLDGDNRLAINNYAYYKTSFDGPDYVYNFMKKNNEEIKTISDRLGTGEYSAGQKEYKTLKTNRQPHNLPRYFSIPSVSEGDTLTFIGYNFTTEQYDFLLAFDDNTNGDLFVDNFLDKLNIPSNLPTNIEPKDKAAGYFLIYSISRISKVYNETK